jgi:holo-ACP synthase
MDTITPHSLAQPVTLEEMLARREDRVAARRRLQERHGRPAVTFTLVTPGPLKDTPATRLVYEEGRLALCRILGGPRYAVLECVDEILPTGPEGFRVVDADPVRLKLKLAALEDTHPLGRLWDLDVTDADGVAVSRATVGMPPRKCLLCDEPAHACARAATHSLAQLERAIRDRIDDYRLRAAC